MRVYINDLHWFHSSESLTLLWRYFILRGTFMIINYFRIKGINPLNIDSLLPFLELRRIVLLLAITLSLKLIVIKERLNICKWFLINILGFKNYSTRIFYQHIRVIHPYYLILIDLKSYYSIKIDILMFIFIRCDCSERIFIPKILQNFSLVEYQR